MAQSELFVFWGSAGHAKVLAELVQPYAKVIALFDNNPETASVLPEVPIYHGSDGLRQWLATAEFPQLISAAVAIGGSRGKDRHELALRLKSAGLGLPTLIHPGARVAPSVCYEEGCQILAHALLAADVLLGEACIINHSANVDHECRLGHGVHIGPGATLCGCVSVEDYAMIGAGAVILPRIVIGAGAIVGAGAVVTRHVAAGSVVAGNPARLLKSNEQQDHL
jgi:sugar O-acyltransferase (sialic acid O-acetyltransferase NeuD family)